MENEIIKIESNEKKGIWVIMIMYLISWGAIISPYPIFRLIGWIALGLVGFTLWRIIDGLLERAKKERNENG